MRDIQRSSKGRDPNAALKTPRGRLPWAGWTACILFSLAILALHLLIGGTRYVFAIPGYAILAVAAWFSLFHRPQGGRADPWCLGSVLLFAAYLLWRTWTSPQDYITWFHLLLVPACVVVYLLSVHKLSSMRFRLWTSGFFLTLVVVQVVIGLVQFLKIRNYLPFGFIRADYGIRASGFFVCPNHYAGFLELSFFVGLALACWGRIRPAWRILAGYAALVAVVGIVISGSRGSYLSVMAGLVVFLIWSLWLVRRALPHLFWKLTTAAIVCVLMGGAAVGVAISKNFLLSQRASNLIDLENMRVTMWRSAWEQHLLQPIMGTGAGSFLMYGRQFREPRIQHDPIHTHNDYLQLLAEFGWIGVGLFLICWLTHMRGGWRQIRAIIDRRIMETGRATSTRLALILGAFCGLVALTAHGVVDFNMHIPGVTLVMIWLLGWLGGAPEKSPGTSRASRPVNWLSNGLLSVLAAGLLWGGWKLYRQEAVTEEVRVLVRERQYEEAMKAARQIDTEAVTNPYFFHHLGDAFKGMGDQLETPFLKPPFYDQAANTYLKGYALFPEDVHLAVQTAATLDQMGRFEESAPIWQEALRWDPNLVRLLNLYGWHLQRQGKLEEARDLYERALEIRGGDRFAKLHLQSVKAALELQTPATEGQSHTPVE